jgi:hypothetical protein
MLFLLFHAPRLCFYGSSTVWMAVKLPALSVAAADVVLTPDDLDEIDRGAAEITPEGARYSESSPRMVDR